MSVMEMNDSDFNKLSRAINRGDIPLARRLAGSTGLISPDDVEAVIDQTMKRKQGQQRGLGRFHF